MEKAFEIEFKEYAPFLQKLDIPFSEESIWLTSGSGSVAGKWWLFVSATTLETTNLLWDLLPILKREGVQFRLIKNQLLQYQLNSGAFGDSEVGKVVTIIAETEQQAVWLLSEIRKITYDIHGPGVPGTLRLDNVIYALFADTDPAMLTNSTLQQINMYIPPRTKIPFPLLSAYQKTKSKKIVGRRYLLVDTIRTSFKGATYKAIDLRKLDYCLVKEAKAHSVDDHLGRDMKDRLIWQKQAITDLAGQIPTATVRSYFEKADSAFLVTDFIEGKTLRDSVMEETKGQTWVQLSNPVKIQLLKWYFQTLTIAETLHSKGYIHRDLTDGNFIIQPDGQLQIIDFEFAYNQVNKTPEPPFLLGTAGYCAPEQIAFAVADPKEDIYALGALLSFFISGELPSIFIGPDSKHLESKLNKVSNSQYLTVLIVSCLSRDRNNRPTLTQIKQSIKQLLYEHNIKS